MSHETIHGHVAPGYEVVQDAFAANFAVHDELGAAFAAYVDGAPVVDLWGGTAVASDGRAWTRETLQLIFSGTKGLVASAILLLVDRGLLELDAPVARYWPEFGAAGKSRITVGDALSHQAGLPSIAEPVTYDDVLDDRAMAERLARQAPLWPGQQRVAYHSLTYGWLAGEIVRRVAGVSVGRLFADEIARPLELDAWIGLPEREEPRVSTIELHASFRSFWDEAMRSEELARISGNPFLFAEPLFWNRPAAHRAEIPGAGGIASARAVAALYGCLACGGELAGTRLLSRQAIAAGVAERVRGVDPFRDERLAFGSGFQLQTRDALLGPVLDAFGHGGAGGSMHGAWPGKRTGFSYTMNQMRDETTDERARLLLASLYTAVTSARP